MYYGDLNPSDVLRFKFTTVTTTGAPTSLAGTPAISVYKTNSTTQSTSGVTLTVDFDSVTGLNHVDIDTSADGTFYAAGADFAVVITTGTVGGTSVVGYMVGHFSIQNRNFLRPTTAGRTLDVSSGGEAGVDWANIGSPTTAQTLSGTSTKALEPTTAGRTLDVTATGEAGIDWSNIGAPTTTVNLSGTTVKTATDVETDTQDIQARLPAALVSGRIDASVGVMAANTLTASALASDAVNEIVDQVWDETLSGHVSAGSTGEALSNAGGTTFPSNFSSLSIDSNGRVKALVGLTKNVAVPNFTFVMTNATTHAPMTGLTVSGTVKKDSGAFGALTNSVSEVANGWYVVDLAAGDVNGDVISLRFTATGADDRDVSFVTSD